MPHIDPIASIDQLGFCRAAFIRRLPDIDVATDRETALARLRPAHHEILRTSGFTAERLTTAEQVHGNLVALVDSPPSPPAPAAAADGLATATPHLCLGIYVADCAAIWIADPTRRAIALVHSGKKGTALDILGSAIELLNARFGSQPRDLTVAVSPCIRPPDYEIDFAADIAAQAHRHGVRNFSDPGTNTAADLAAYYSYRTEMGQTGRMLAVMEIIAPQS